MTECVIILDPVIVFTLFFCVQLKTEDHATAYDICQLVAIAVCMRQLLATIHRDYAIVSCRNI